jgi:hypothetical protein
MNSDAELSSKTTAVEASKKANAVFISAIQALKLVERDATDGAVTTAFTDQYQTLLAQSKSLHQTRAFLHSLQALLLMHYSALAMFYWLSGMRLMGL